MRDKSLSVDKPLTDVKRYSLSARSSKVNLRQQGKPFLRGGSFRGFLDTMPEVLAASELKKAACAIIEARNRNKPVVLGMGAHPIKVGLSPLITDLMKQGTVTAIATNGASIVHDFEMAFMGCTSEDVASELCHGTFGMAEETGVMLNMAISDGVTQGLGLGSSIGRFIASDSRITDRSISIFATAFDLNIPITVHVAIGTDILHMHPEANGSNIGEGSMRDFRTLTSLITTLDGGVFINLGSAVIIPEVFLKALNLARNIGHRVEDFTTINMDFIRQYRAEVNVLKRPTANSGLAISLIGHHEIMFPMLCAIVTELKDDD
ncbi:deoxyhypusine synthase family protein [Candidatus Magnetobacterium casense]|uniref:Deoxyhypusine synthase family protein n=1 Tax=Candidatus Magnetobacterium casense TaxID=1455061 RepID=A0ABS6RXH0_9BACT|nr:deoxyhypusine synthase family protein [Candidatus Magnetobacterium casensis]MBV6341324.1 deoxyhypusine synthase family protein [Candidatus Magnetobacterium casensis]